MPQILTTNAILRCPHQGLGTSVPVPPPRQCTIQGGFVLLSGDTGLIPCPNIVPCASYALTSMNLNSTRLDGRNVMLVTDFIQSVTGFPLTATETHTVFDKTPPPAPPGGAAPQPAGPSATTPPEIPPELQETDKPTVSVAPPELPFSIATFSTSGTPPALIFTFTIHSEYPRRWTLFHISPPATYLDVTNGLPPGIVVAPPGGTWSSGQKTLPIVVTVTGLYASSLPPSLDHSFVVTAVNHRGLSAFAEAKIKVSP
jgi:hypothetical protein